MAQGIWIHEDRQLMADGRREKRALRWNRGRCRHANMYIGYSDRVKQVDTHCARCGVRVRFNLDRRKGDGRGQVQQVKWIPMPKASRKELEAKVQHLNKIDFNHDEGFSTALELMKKKSESRMGGDLD